MVVHFADRTGSGTWEQWPFSWPGLTLCCSYVNSRDLGSTSSCLRTFSRPLPSSSSSFCCSSLPLHWRLTLCSGTRYAEMQLVWYRTGDSVVNNGRLCHSYTGIIHTYTCLSVCNKRCVWPNNPFGKTGSHS